MSDWYCSCGERLCILCGNCHYCGPKTCPQGRNIMKRLIRVICETILSWLGPEQSMLVERPLHVDWDPTVPRYCDHCIGTWLTYQPNVWFCRNCGWLAISTWSTPPMTDPDALAITEPRQKAIAVPTTSHAVAVTHVTEKRATGELTRRFHRKYHAGEVSFHGIELQWEDTGEIPAITSYSPDEHTVH